MDNKTKKSKNILGVRRAKKNEKIDNLPKISILKTLQVKVTQMEIDVDDKLFEKFVKIGLAMVKNDKKALFNYAMNKALDNRIDSI
jgi:hypothetical protein